MLVPLVPLLVPLVVLVIADTALGVSSDPRSDDDCAPMPADQHPCSIISGLRQSPVAIDTCSAATVSSLRRPLRITHLDEVPLRMTVENTGDRLAGDVFWSHGREPTITGGRLAGEYVFDLYDLHWSANGTARSEHTIDGRRFVGELHLGFRNVKYRTIGEALGKVDGVVALAVMLEEDVRSPGRGITGLAPALLEIREAFTTVELVSPPTVRELLPRNLHRYVQYDGSFTSVPPCSEAAIWIILLEPIRVVGVELELLRQLRDSSGYRICTSSNRQLQPLSGRRLYYSGRPRRC